MLIFGVSQGASTDPLEKVLIDRQCLLEKVPFFCDGSAIFFSLGAQITLFRVIIENIISPDQVFC